MSRGGPGPPRMHRGGQRCAERACDGRRPGKLPGCPAADRGI